MTSTMQPAVRSSESLIKRFEFHHESGRLVIQWSYAVWWRGLWLSMLVVFVYAVLDDLFSNMYRGVPLNDELGLHLMIAFSSSLFVCALWICWWMFRKRTVKFEITPSGIHMVDGSLHVPTEADFIAFDDIYDMRVWSFPPHIYIVIPGWDLKLRGLRNIKEANWLLNRIKSGIAEFSGWQNVPSDENTLS